jgi:hypothetical protein
VTPDTKRPSNLDGSRSFAESSEPVAEQLPADGTRGPATPAGAPEGDKATRRDPVSASREPEGNYLGLLGALAHAGNQITKWVPGPSSVIAVEEQLLREQLLANDSPGG